MQIGFHNSTYSKTSETLHSGFLTLENTTMARIFGLFALIYSIYFIVKHNILYYFLPHFPGAYTHKNSLMVYTLGSTSHLNTPTLPPGTQYKCVSVLRITWQMTFLKVLANLNPRKAHANYFSNFLCRFLVLT